MIKYLCFLFLVLLTACTGVIETLPIADADRYKIQEIAAVKHGGPMDLSADGHMVAWSDTGLNLFMVETHQRRRLLDTTPDAICWSPDGKMLVAVVPQDGDSHLYVFSQAGQSVYDEKIPGRVSRLQWLEHGSLTAGILDHTTYKFGTHIVAHLLQWDALWRTTQIPLYETTIKPVTAVQLAGHLHETLDFDISSFGDEVLYTRLYAPPAFAATRHLVLRHLQTAVESKIADLPLIDGAGRLTSDGESALISNGVDAVRLEEMWNSERLTIWAGDSFSYAPPSGLIVVGNQLYQGGRSVLRLPPSSHAQISFGGDFLLVKWHSQLYLLSGYLVSHDNGPKIVDMEKLLKLRRLRSRGLIEPDEYHQSRERLLQ